MNPASRTLFVVDDDPAILLLLRTAGAHLGVRVETYASGIAFLRAFEHGRDGCLVLELNLPDHDGLRLQQELNDLDSYLPVIMISRHGDVPTVVRAMQQGALTFVEKPFGLEAITEHIAEALATSAGWRETRDRKREARARLAQLTEPQRAVMELLTLGLSNREIADRLNLSLRAIEDRKSRLFQALEVTTLVELFRLAAHAKDEQRALKLRAS